MPISWPGPKGRGVLWSGGKEYLLSRRFHSKSDAQAHAKQVRKTGRGARVLKDQAYYAVYVERRGGVA